MLTLNSLIDEARRAGLPLDKKRGILREYLQTLILNAIYKHKLGNKLYFMGGTALRFLHNLPRFSEDLDFNARGLSSREFDVLLDVIRVYLENESFKVTVKRKDIYDVYSARIGFKSVMKNFGLTDTRGEDIVIKVEVNNPEWKIKSEAFAISFFGFLFTVLAMDKGSFLAEKSHAFIYRCRGRDVYDVLFMLRRRFPLDKRMFLSKKIKGSPKRALLKKFKNLSEAELRKLAKQVRPFLFREEEAEFVEKASFYGPELLKNYK